MRDCCSTVKAKPFEDELLHSSEHLREGTLRRFSGPILFARGSPVLDECLALKSSIESIDQYKTTRYQLSPESDSATLHQSASMCATPWTINIVRPWAVLFPPRFVLEPLPLDATP